MLTLLCCSGLVVGAILILDRPVLKRVGETLARQRIALLVGDEAGYLSVLDPQAAQADRDRLLVQFRSLRAMKIAGWSDDPVSPIRKDGDLWEITVRSSPCFVTDGCAYASALASTVWNLAGESATLVQWAPSSKRPHPWQISELVALAGARTIVATTKPHEAKLAAVLAEAEKAALVADRFAQDGEPPSRYVIYWAPEHEWNTWFDEKPSSWMAGMAVQVSSERYEMMLNGETDDDEIDDLLRHELTHAASMPGRITGGDELWWLMEGLAELAEMEGSLVAENPGIANVVAIANDPDVDGLEVVGPKDTAEGAAASGLYTFAFLAVRCISERFGETKMVEFFHAVVHGDGDNVAEKAAPEVFDVSWAQLQQECLAYIKQAAR